MIEEMEDLEDASDELSEEVAGVLEKRKEGDGALSERDMSGFPVSIGTGLALETLFDPIMEVVDEGRSFNKLGDLSRYDAYLINVETLVRNIISSVATSEVDALEGDDVLGALVDEMEFLNYFFSDNNLNIRYYINSYAAFKDNYDKDLRKPSTPKQHHTLELTNFCLDKIKESDLVIEKFHHYISFKSVDNALVLTHIPADLLSYSKFKVLDLLESHTGAIKPREEFNTKYYPIPREDMSFLPFFEYLLVVFGDKVMFKPQPLKKRKEVIESLKRLEVHPLMSEFSLGLFHAFK